MKSSGNQDVNSLNSGLFHQIEDGNMPSKQHSFQNSAPDK